jgi:hypothetical protein
MGLEEKVTMMVDGPQSPPKPWRRFLRFSLRGLLVLVAVCSVWLGIAFHRAREQARAVAIIKHHSGYIVYDYNQLPTGFFDFKARSGIPEWLLDILGEDFFHDVTYVKADRVRDDVLEVICGLREIRLLILDESAITGRGMAHLKRLHKLDILEIDSPLIDDRALAEIAGSRHLRVLEISNANVGDEGIEHVKRLARLQELRLHNTRVTSAGAAALSEQLPDCRIYVSGEKESLEIGPRQP